MLARHVRSIVECVLTVCALATYHSESRAAEKIAEDQASRGGLEEIVVTAQRREERAQNVPISISTYTSQDLESKQLGDMTTLGLLTPNMATAQAYNPGDIRIQLRGITELVPQIGSDPAVGVYVDGVYHGFNPGLDIADIDMDRVEVLMGPQGTLFGRNTIGGAINITTKKPTDKLEGFVDVAFGNYNTRKYSGVLNLPIVGNTIDARLVYQHDDHSGYDRDIFLNKDLNSGKQDYVRGTLRVVPNDRWEILITGNYSKFEGNSVNQKLDYLDPTLSLAPGLPPLNALLPAVSGHPGDLLTNYVGGGFYNNYGNVDSRIFVQTEGATATIIGSFGLFSVKSITNYSRLTQNNPDDVDGTPYAFVDILNFPANLDQFSQELQAYGDGNDQRLRWISGLYFYTDHGTQGHLVAVLSDLTGINSDGKQAADNKSYAGFAQLTYEIAPSVRLTGGVRYTQDSREMTWYDRSASAMTGNFEYCALANDPYGTNPAQCSYTNHVNYHYFPWTVGLDFKPTDRTLLYAKVSRGFRSGGFSQAGPPAIAGPAGQPPPAAANAISLAEGGAPFAPESLLSPEIGLKWEGLDNRLRVNAAAFYSDYKHIQLSENLPPPPGSLQPLSVIRNVGVGRVYGGELNATLLAVGDLLLNANLGLLDPKYTQGPNVGLPFINTSRTSWSAGAEYPWRLPVGALRFNLDYSRRSTLYFFEPIPGNAAQTAAVSQRPYGLLDAKVAMQLTRMPLTISVFGRNLTNTQYKVQATDFVASGLGADVYIPGLPRLYGISLRYDF
jgi:iron complex outermembrane receptor protein